MAARGRQRGDGEQLLPASRRRAGHTAVPIVVVSCEHASNRIPGAYRALFRDAAAELRGHRGWDIGAAAVARVIARRLRAPLFAGSVSRLLVDLNRSLHHPRVLSTRTRSLPPDQKSRLVDLHYRPYREALKARLGATLDGGARVLHVSVHSFTPAWKGARRRADIGILYDPARSMEVVFARSLQEALAEAEPRLAVRRNYPYRGTSDGFSVALRRIFSARRYACLEIEVNQKLLRSDAAQRRMGGILAAALSRVLAAKRGARTAR